MHVKLLSISVSAPDKKGRRDVTLNKAGGPRAVDFASFVDLDDAAFETIDPLLDALRNAGVESSG